MTNETTLRNNFHGTEITITPGANGVLSDSQARDIRKTLCGVDGCTCGDGLGCRGPQEADVEEYAPGAFRIDEK